MDQDKDSGDNFLLKHEQMAGTRDFAAVLRKKTSKPDIVNVEHTEWLECATKWRERREKERRNNKLPLVTS
jgi:hypothetical protein